MKKLILFLSVVILGTTAFSQPIMKLSKTEHDYGKFKEEAGILSKCAMTITTSSGTAVPDISPTTFRLDRLG